MTRTKTAIVVVALLAGASGAMNTACSSDESPTSTKTDAIASDLELRDAMRELWMDHVTLTRVYLISAIAGLPGTEEAAGRLLQNQQDIGDAIKPFYGEEAGDALAVLLTEHISIAVEIVAAAKADNATDLADASDRWKKNADAVAVFLADANPAWPVADLKAMMRTHLEQTLAEATARLGEDWDADVAAYDEVVQHILAMADVLSAGISAQFPDLVSSDTPRNARDQALHRTMRELWTDHVAWTRVYLISAIAGLPGTEEAAGRLLQNQEDIGDAIKPFYGEGAGDALAVLLTDHISIAVEIVAAAKADNTADLADASGRWTDNADAIAVFLADANPAWPVADLKAMMHAHLEQTLAEATARLNEDWDADVTAYDEVVHHILAMADVLSAGISTQFPKP